AAIPTGKWEITKGPKPILPRSGSWKGTNEEMERRAEYRPPSPRPSPPGEGEPFARCWRWNTPGYRALRNESWKGGEGTGDVGNLQVLACALPLPGGEGRGEGGSFSTGFHS